MIGAAGGFLALKRRRSESEDGIDDPLMDEQGERAAKTGRLEVVEGDDLEQEPLKGAC
jgi:hypothetical protein